MKNILLIDDNAQLLEALSLWIGMCFRDWKILTAKNGREGTEILDSLPVSFILTDLQMPVMDGYGVIEHRNRNHPFVPLFAMTGDSSPEVVEKLWALRVSECIEKPFNFDLLVRKISNTLDALSGAAMLAGSFQQVAQAGSTTSRGGPMISAACHILLT